VIWITLKGLPRGACSAIGKGWALWVLARRVFV